MNEPFKAFRAGSLPGLVRHQALHQAGLVSDRCPAFRFPPQEKLDDSMTLTFDAAVKGLRLISGARYLDKPSDAVTLSVRSPCSATDDGILSPILGPDLRRRGRWSRRTAKGRLDAGNRAAPRARSHARAALMDGIGAKRFCVGVLPGTAMTLQERSGTLSICPPVKEVDERANSAGFAPVADNLTTGRENV